MLTNSGESLSIRVIDIATKIFEKVYTNNALADFLFLVIGEINCENALPDSDRSL